jgi:hypothetical protein
LRRLRSCQARLLAFEATRGDDHIGRFRVRGPATPNKRCRELSEAGHLAVERMRIGTRSLPDLRDRLARLEDPS